MPHARHARLTHLVDRSTRASVALVVLLTLASLATAGGLLSAQHRIAEHNRVLALVHGLEANVQTMRLSVGAWVLTGDATARVTWGRAASDERVRLQALKSALLPDEAASELVASIEARLAEHAGASSSFFTKDWRRDRDVHIGEMMGSSYQQQHMVLADALDALIQLERGRIVRIGEREDIALFTAGVALLVLVGWSVLTLRRSRNMARSLLANLERAFRANERGRAELQAFIDAAPLAVFHVDTHGIPNWLNAKAATWVGERRGEAVSEFLIDGIAPGDRDRVVRAWRRLIDTGERFDEVFGFSGDDRVALWAHAHATPVAPGGRTTGFVAVLEDITEAQTLHEELARSRTRMRRMTDAVPALIARVDENEIYRFVNATYRAWFGDAAPRIGSTLREFVGEENYARLAPVFARVRCGEAVRLEINQATLQGRRFTGDVSYTPDLDEGGRFCGMYVMVTDVSERKTLEENLFAAKELAQVTLESIGDAVLTTDRDGTVTFLNPRAEALLAREASRARGRPIDAVVGLRDDQGHPSETSLLRAIREERVVDMPHPRQLLFESGARVDVEDVAAPIRDRDGQVVGGVLVLRDVSVARAVAERMRQLAESDALTGLPNRMVFDERLRTALQALGPEETLAVLYMDLDGFKAVNDVHGHIAGDELLRQFAARLLVETAPGDTVCRLGGDEFVALLAPPVSVREAVVRAEAFIDIASRPFVWHDVELRVTLSVGIASAPLHGSAAHALVRDADIALYAAKAAGKNQVRVAGC
ncbi:diguanylate cyclase [Luteibacter pinisoli]|uniref:Diguanylate cyclase n=1 Tax=Luteibacter pinisoli TaxID=2589080 RepID=A0A4Y5Z3W0_9GAMM|nr:diguanylate cyclase [Luteibacter pinisoli]QDE39827.1 diguanylate cyclase [Luteibacter pinisoli]